MVLGRMVDLRAEQASDVGAAVTPRGGRDLLPYEAQLCDTLGITRDEYLYFCALTDAHNGKRAKEYDLAGVPDVRNDPVSIIISLVIGIAMSAISMLLTPKPKDNQAPQLKTADATGAKKFAALDAFDSSQELATLGAIIPLVFTRRTANHGGIRVKLMLLWSQLLSEGTGQQMKAVFTAGMSPLGAAPDFDGYAIGDLLLKSYSSAKVALYFKNNGRISEANRYGQGTLTGDPAYDLCSAYADRVDQFRPMFSGTRNPSTQSKFGVFGAMPNASRYMLNYELVMVQKNTKNKNDLYRKREKLARSWESYCGVYETSRTSWGSGQRHLVYPGDLIQYVITESKHADNPYWSPWGLTDANGISEERRNFADDNIRVGEMYLIGSALCVCESVETGVPWILGMRKHISFKVQETGGVTAWNPWLASGQPYDDIVQKVTVATVSNNRTCDVTELGIRSVVWKQISGFPNVNSHPSDAVVAQYENEDGSIQLGTVQRYVKRYSFFRLQIRPLGSNDWADLTNGKVFCVTGNTPQAQYNYLRIMHPRGQWEFRLLPVPGSDVAHHYRYSTIYELNPGDRSRIVIGDKAVTFSGRERRLGQRSLSNGIWFKGTPPPDPAGEVWSLDHYTVGVVPTYIDWTALEERGDDRNNWVSIAGQMGQAIWDGRKYPITQGIFGGFYSSALRPLLQAYTKGDRIVKVIGGFRKTTLWSVRRMGYGAVEYPPTYVADLGGTGGAGYGLVVRVYWWPNGAQRWEVIARGAGYYQGDLITVYGLGNPIQFRVSSTDDDNTLENHMNPLDALADIALYEAESFSHDSEPEHEIAYVNEQLEQIDGQVPQYGDLALVGLRLNAAKEWSNFSQLTAYVKQGLMVERLIDDNGNPVAESSVYASTNNLPEIAYALLTDPRIGAGKTIGKLSVDREKMQAAARYCHANGFNWDGMVGEKLNLREWIYQQAGYCLLDFTILGGQFALAPSVPFDASYRIAPEQKPEVKALFTDGNMRDLKVSWLSPEERQLFKAVVRYRDEVDNGFSRTRTITTWLSYDQGGSDADPEEEFDLSSFCTSREHALTFAMAALKLRKEVDHGMTFETTPGSGLVLSPGDYVRVVSEVTHTSRFNNGSINSEGYITSTTVMADGEYRILYWVPGTVGTQEGNMTVSDGKTTGYFGAMFTLLNSTTMARLYKVESIERSDEAFVKLALSYQPVDENGYLKTLDWNPLHFITQES